jgi:hypothetical protein
MSYSDTVLGNRKIIFASDPTGSKKVPNPNRSRTVASVIPFTKIQEAYLERSEPTERADKQTNVKKLPVRHVELQRHPDRIKNITIL